MKIPELKENQPLNVIEATYHLQVPISQLCSNASEPRIVEEERIQMKIFTDGIIDKVSEEKVEKINNYYIGKQQYQYALDTLKTKDIYFKNHSYVVIFLIAKTWYHNGHLHSWLDVVKDVSIYLENPRDRKALKDAKLAIKDIQENNRSGNYTTVLSSLLSPRRGLIYFEPKEISKNIYTLKKTKK